MSLPTRDSDDPLPFCVWREAQTDPVAHLTTSTSHRHFMIPQHFFQAWTPSRSLEQDIQAIYNISVSSSGPHPFPAPPHWVARPGVHPPPLGPNPLVTNTTSKRVSHQPSHLPPSGWAWSPQTSVKTPPLQAGIRKKLETCC